MTGRQKMVTAIVCAVLVAGAILGGAFLLRPKPQTVEERQHEAQIACP